jgi:P4 family phage/plasmid primase-like protien
VNAPDRQLNQLIPDKAKIAEFLSHLPEGLTTFCSIPAAGGAPSGLTFDLPYDIEAAAEWGYAQNIRLRGVYWSVNPSTSRLSKKPSKSDIAHGRFLHRDIDPSKDPSIPYLKRHADILAKIEMFQETEPVPAIIIDSGHGCYPIYRLDVPADKNATEAANQYIGRDDGDGTWNIDRLLRLPGTINWPQQRKVEKYGYPEEAVMCRLVRAGNETYPIADFLPPETLEHQPQAKLVTPQCGNTAISLDSLPNELRLKIVSGAPEGERSDTFHHVICWLGDLDYSVDAIVALLQAWPTGIAEKYIERLQPEVERSYAKRQPQARSQYSRKQLAEMIDATNDFDQLTKDILLHVYQAEITDSERLSLLKLIAKKSGVSVQALKADAQNFKSVGANKDFLHLAAAREVVQMHGDRNLLHSAGNLWRWTGDGVWRLQEDRDIKQKIHDVADGVELTSNIVNSILDLTKTEVHRSGHRFDMDVQRINCQNGELEYDDTLGWLLTPHVREHYRTTMIPVAYDKDATAERFRRFLGEIFKGDPDADNKIAIVEEALGYSLISSCYLEKFLLLIGAGANGKSVLLAALSALLGPDHVCAVQPSQFDNKFQRGHLFGKLANIITEIAQGAEIADDKLKSLVSGEVTTAEHKFKDPFDFIPFATHWFGTNHLPHTRDFSDALFRRAIVLTFNNRFEGNTCDVNLTAKLRAELPGILNVALEGLSRLMKNGAFTECSSSEDIKRQWRLEADQARQFVEECCTTNSTYWCSSSELYTAYLRWAEAAGIRKTLNKNNLTSRLVAMGFSKHKGTNGDREIFGLKLIPRGSY